MTPPDASASRGLSEPGAPSDGSDGVEVYVSVGSNVEPMENVPAALAILMEVATVTGVSTMYRTAALRRPDAFVPSVPFVPSNTPTNDDDPPFVNGIWRIETSTPPRTLKFDTLRGIERRLGRVRGADSYAPRTIDLDIVLYCDRVIEEDGLVVPDPDILERPFLAVPLVELDPDLRVPGSRLTLATHPVSARTDGMIAMPELTRRLKEMVDL